MAHEYRYRTPCALQHTRLLVSHDAGVSSGLSTTPAQPPSITTAHSHTWKPTRPCLLLSNPWWRTPMINYGQPGDVFESFTAFWNPLDTYISGYRPTSTCRTDLQGSIFARLTFRRVGHSTLENLTSWSTSSDTNPPYLTLLSQMLARLAK